MMFASHENPLQKLNELSNAIHLKFRPGQILAELLVGAQIRNNGILTIKMQIPVELRNPGRN